MLDITKVPLNVRSNVFIAWVLQASFQCGKGRQIDFLLQYLFKVIRQFYELQTQRFHQFDEDIDVTAFCLIAFYKRAVDGDSLHTVLLL